LKSFNLKKQPLKKFSLFFPFFALLIQACGGGSSSESEPIVIEPTEYELNLSSVIVNKCGVESPYLNLELLIQDENWQITQRYTPDENGQIKVSLFRQNINYTLVAKRQIGNEEKGLDIHSYIQVETSTPIAYKGVYESITDQSSCECITQDVNISHRSYNTRSQVASSLNFTDWQAIDNGTTLLNGVEACREVNGDWPLHSFSIVGTDVNNNSIGNATFSDNFNATSSEVWELSAFDVAEQTSLPAEHQAFKTSQIIQTISHFANSIDANEEGILLFNSHDYIGETLYHSVAQVVFEETSSIFGSSIIESYHQIRDANFNESFSVQASNVKPDIDEVNFSEIQADGSYDYSVVQNYPMALIQFNYELFDAQAQTFTVNWTTYGPIQGLLPVKIELTGYEDIIGVDSDWNEIDVRLLQSAVSSTYDDYVSYFQNFSNDNLVSNLNTYHIEINK